MPPNCPWHGLWTIEGIPLSRHEKIKIWKLAVVPPCFTLIFVNQLTRWELLFLRLFVLMQQPLWSMENGTKFHGSNVIVLLNFKLHNWQTVHTTILDLMHFKLRKLENFQFSICLCGPTECAERLNRAPRWRQPAGRPLGSTLPTPKHMCLRSHLYDPE